MVVKDAAHPAMDAAVRNVEIIVGPFGVALIDVGSEGRAGGAQPGMEIVGILIAGNRRAQAGAPTTPAIPSDQEERCHMHGPGLGDRPIRAAGASRHEKTGVPPRARDSRRAIWRETTSPTRHL